MISNCISILVVSMDLMALSGINRSENMTVLMGVVDRAISEALSIVKSLACKIDVWLCSLNLNCHSVGAVSIKVKKERCLNTFSVTQPEANVFSSCQGSFIFLEVIIDGFTLICTQSYRLIDREHTRMNIFFHYLLL